MFLLQKHSQIPTALMLLCRTKQGSLDVVIAAVTDPACTRPLFRVSGVVAILVKHKG